MNPPENSIVKKMCLTDVTNRSTIYEIDEDNILDESAVQLLVREILLMVYQDLGDVLVRGMGSTITISFIIGSSGYSIGEISKYSIVT